MPDILADIFNVKALHFALWAMLIAFGATFVGMFVARWFGLKRRLSRFIGAVRSLKQTGGLPQDLPIADPRLGHLWTQYANTLHLPLAAVDPRTGTALPNGFRATVPADAIFTALSVYEGRIHTEFFKHLPGLLTGLGIIGTFVGLIDGLGKSIGTDGALDTKVLIGSVKEAFLFSGSAIAFAMVVTFLEKMIVAGLHGTVEDLCQAIDELYVGGAGEDYLSRLVVASENSADHAAILKDELVERLGTILTELAAKQIAASAQQQERLQQSLVAAIDNSLTEPLGKLANTFDGMRGDQGEQLSRSLQDSMSAFADRLNEILGGQVGQAKELQMQTMQALQQAIGAFQAMAQQVGNAGDNATSAMTSRLTAALDEMAIRQAQMSDHIRALVDDMRSATLKSQADAGEQTQQLLTLLGQQVQSVSETLQTESATARLQHQSQLSEVADHTRQATDELVAGIKAQTFAIGQATATMRNAVGDLAAAVSRNVEQVGQGAVRIEQAAERFSGAGRVVADVLDQSKAVTTNLLNAANTLATSSTQVHAVLTDYRDARDRFASLVSGLEKTIETASRDASMTSELVGSLQRAAAVMGEAQRNAEVYMGKVNTVLETAHASFAKGMAATVQRVGTEANEHLSKATKMLAETVHELDGTLSDTRRAR